MAPKILPRRLARFDYCSPWTYFVTFKVEQRERVFTNVIAASAAASAVQDCRKLRYFYLYAYAIMPDHVHLLIKLANAKRGLSTLVGAIKNRTNYRLREHGLGIKWQPGFHDRVVREYENVGKYVEYILLNPVRAGLVDDFRDYPFAGAPDNWM